MVACAFVCRVNSLRVSTSVVLAHHLLAASERYCLAPIMKPIGPLKPQWATGCAQHAASDPQQATGHHQRIARFYSTAYTAPARAPCAPTPPLPSANGLSARRTPRAAPKKIRRLMRGILAQ